MKLKKFTSLFLVLLLFTTYVKAQVTERKRPAVWDNLVHGGRFMDRFLPIPPIGPLTSNTWGGANVKPRYIDNGIEDKD